MYYEVIISVSQYVTNNVINCSPLQPRYQPIRHCRCTEAGRCGTAIHPANIKTWFYYVIII